MDHNTYPAVSPIAAGLKGRCPRCGEGRLYDGVLTIGKRCNACRLDYAFVDSGDGPTVFVIMLLGFLVLGMALIVEFNFFPPFWVHMVVWIPVIAILGIYAIRVVKSLLVYFQFHNRASQGQLDE
jgi:uncharacterized protein (DUF983 family)